MKKLRKNSFCALYKPRSTCASVPQKISTIPITRQATVSRSEVKKRMILSTGIAIFYRLDELEKGVLLSFDHSFVAHQFVKPRLIVLLNNDSEQPRRTAGPVINSLDRKSTRLNSSHTVISYAVFCLKKKKKKTENTTT